MTTTVELVRIERELAIAIAAILEMDSETVDALDSVLGILRDAESAINCRQREIMRQEASDARAT